MGGRFMEDPRLFGAIAGLKGASGAGVEIEEDPRLAAALGGPPPDAPVSDEFSAPLPTPQVSVPPPSIWQQFVDQLSKQGGRMDQAQAARNDPGNSAPMIGGLVYGASSHALDPLQEQRLSASPGEQRAAELGGAALSPLNYVGGGLPGMVAGQMAQGAVRGFSDTAGAPIANRLVAAGEQGVGSGVTAGALGLLAKAAGGAGSVANWIGDKARGLAYGGAQEITPEVVQAAEKLVPPSIFSPQTTEGYAQKFGGVRDALGAELGGQTARASAEGLDSQVDVNALRAAIAAKQAQVAGGAGAGVRAAASPYDELVDQLTLKPPPNYMVGAQATRQVNPTTVPELHEVKTAYDQGAKYVGGEASEAARAQANKAAADIARGQLYGIMDQSSVGPQFRQTMPSYGTAATVANSAAGAPSGLAAPSGSPTSWAMRQLGQSVGPDVLASTARGVANVANGVGGAINAGTQPASNVAGQAVRSWLGGKGVSMPDPTAGNVPGNQIGERALEALHSNPQILGQPYAQQFAEAEQKGPQAVNDLIIRLDDDPQWRMGPLALLQKEGR